MKCGWMYVQVVKHNAECIGVGMWVYECWVPECDNLKCGEAGMSVESVVWGLGSWDTSIL